MILDVAHHAEKVVAVLTDPYIASDVGPAFSCWEADALARLLLVQAGEDAAVKWLLGHATNRSGCCDGDDSHHGAWLAYEAEDDVPTGDQAARAVLLAYVRGPLQSDGDLGAEAPECPVDGDVGYPGGEEGLWLCSSCGKELRK